MSRELHHRHRPVGIAAIAIAAFFALAGKLDAHEKEPPREGQLTAPDLPVENPWHPRGCGRAGRPHDYVAKTPRTDADRAAVAAAEARRLRRGQKRLRNLLATREGAPSSRSAT